MTYKQLKNALRGRTGRSPVLLCPDCGAQCSANPADYWFLSDGDVFRCSSGPKPHTAACVAANDRSPVELCCCQPWRDTAKLKPTGDHARDRLVAARLNLTEKDSDR